MSEPTQKLRPVAEAAKEPLNLLGVAAVVGVAILVSPAMPFVLGLGALAEAGYLLAAPRSSWYAARLSRRASGGVEQRREKLKRVLFPSIRQEVQDRFNHLEESTKAIAQKMPSRPDWFSQLLAKLDYLLDKFLEFASKEAEFRTYLRTVLDEAIREEGLASPHAGGLVKSQSSKSRWVEEPAADPAETWVHAVMAKVQNHYDAEIVSLNEQRTMDSEDLTTNAVLDKRVDVIERRKDYLNQIGKITINLNHQMELMEDTFGLISDEVRARPPDQILADIDEVIGRTDSLTELLQGFNPPAAAASVDPLNTTA